MTKNDLQFLAHFQPAKTRIPVLELASWSTHGEVFATDLETYVLVKTDLKPESDTLLNAKYAAALAKSKSTFGTRGNALLIDGSEAPVPGLGAEEHPVWPDYGDVCAYTTFQPGDLQKAIKTALPSVSKEESRPILSGICFDFTDKDAPVVATTDRHRLTIVPISPKIEETGALHNKQFVVPAEVLKRLLPFLKDVKTSIQVTFTDAYTVIVFDNKTLVTRNIDGIFPNYRGAVPEAKGTFVNFNRSELATRLKDYLAIVKVNRVSTPRITLIPGTESEPCLTTLSGELGLGPAYVPAPLEASIPIPSPIAFNGSYLLDVMNQFPTSETITFAFDGPLRSVKITGTGSDTLIVLMPMTLPY